MLALLANPLVRKVVIYGAIALGILYAFRLWLNKHDNKVFQEGKESIAEEIRKEKETEIRKAREALELEKQRLLGTIEQLSHDMDKLHGNLNEAIKQSKKDQGGVPIIVSGVPDSDLNGTIREVLSGQFAIGNAGTTPGPPATP